MKIAMILALGVSIASMALAASKKNQTTMGDLLKQVSKKEESEKKNNEESSKLKKKLNSRLKILEEELGIAKKEKEKLEKELSDQGVYSDADKFKNTLSRFNQQEEKVKMITKEWEDVFEQLSGLE